MRRILTSGGLAAALLAGPAAPLAVGSAAGSAAGGGSDRVDTGRQPLVSYHATFVPPGAATARVRAQYGADGGTVVRLRVWGLAPNRAYGAHAHKSSCGATDPTAAGGHFQHEQDPVQPSTDPAYANAHNEIWLDFTTDEHGNATARAVVDWRFPDDRRAGSVIIHDHHTKTGPTGQAGTAGARHGCLTVPF
ncbi:superoxide dismutase [Streptomyces venezuelae]|uniref:Superoxide dismutase n=1 Tax=Streptomyces venezuelae TaxID=54571 RepID=A0A5P2DAW5_STRVZ|nr:superoxide dismutase family protein [Streptomyces venezuelae]QES50411.1 superoxide dismutase [Streptomyces venezuelae]